MPIVIMKTDSSPVAMDWTRPHAVWIGTFKTAVQWCERKNSHPNNYTTRYEAIKVKNEGTAPNAEVTGAGTASGGLPVSRLPTKTGRQRTKT